jgi:hypothetical protein
MKKIFILTISLAILASCADSLEDWNVNKKAASVVPARTFLTGAQKNLSDILTTPNVNNNNYRMFVQYWTTTTYLDEPRYNMTSRLYSENFWNVIYRDVISDLREGKRLIEADASIVEGVKKNQLAIFEIFEVYAWSVLINTFGDVPYSEALDPSNSTPKYDDAEAIYNDIVDRLDVAISSLDPGLGSFNTGATSADIIFRSNVASWLRFAKSLKLRLGMLISDSNPSKSKSMVEDAASDLTLLISSNAQNAKFPYLDASPNNNPISSNLHSQFTSREDFLPANTIVDKMNELNDPRRKFYFSTYTDPVDGPIFKGGIYGFTNTYAEHSHISDKIITPSFEALLLDYVEVEFLLAEAVERGYNVAGTAEEHYNKAIEASILYWGGTAAEVTDYLAQDEVAYTTAAGDFKEKIGLQKWIAFNNRGWDYWVEWRRLDQPQLLPPSGESIPNALFIPVRMIYPVKEQTANSDKWTAAAAKYNSDSPNSNIFWDAN